jgi:arginyl-tRNA synthetase
VLQVPVKQTESLLVNPFSTISDAILAKFPELTADDLPFGPPPKIDLGDVALRMFEAARKLKTPPPQLAARIVKEVEFGAEVISASVAGPYVNFKLDRGKIAAQIVGGIFREGAMYGSSRSGVGKKVLLEHTSINPNASPHLGRSRNAMIGDGITRLLRLEGYDVSVHYYVNDMGRQIALLTLLCREKSALTFDQMLDLYVEANARAQAEPEFAQEGYALLAKMEQGDEQTRRDFRVVTDLCLKGQLAVLARLDISYNEFDRESDYLKDPRLDPVMDALREKGALFTDEDGRLVVDLSKLGYTQEEGRYFVLLRANGSSMYGYRDLAYTIYKMEQGADANVIVLGEDHKLYFQQIGMILEAGGKGAPEPIYYSYILLKEGKMSTRQGNVVLLSDFLDEATRRAAEKVEAQCTELPAEERAAIAAHVAVAAIRFAILRVGSNKNVIFDWESSLSFTGDTGPYVQYSSARINSILRKYGELSREIGAEFPVQTDAEWALVSKLASFPSAVAGAVAQRSCAPVAQFALETARVFTTFYHECPVLAAETPALRVARAQLCAATRTVLENVLALLGIKALERM